MRSLIATGRMRPGEQILQQALPLKLGVSRVPLREALKILEGEGQVTYVARRGYFVAMLSLADLLEVYRIREILEAEAVRIAIPLMTDEDIDRFEEAAYDVERAAAVVDVTTTATANRRFHATLIEACALPRLVRIIRQLWDTTEVYRAVYYTRRFTRLRERGATRRSLAVWVRRASQRLIHVPCSHRRQKQPLLVQHPCPVRVADVTSPERPASGGRVWRSNRPAY